MGFLNKMKTASNGDIHCDWCGAYIKNDMNGGFVEQMGFGIVKRGISLAKKYYCSAACRSQAEAAEKAKKEDYEMRKVNGQLTEMEQMKEDIKAPVADAVGEVGNMMKDTLGDSMSQMTGMMKGSMAGMLKGFGKKK